MTDIAIRVENLSKQFHIGAIQKNRNFREALVDGVTAPFRRTINRLRGQAKGAELDETIWALKDVSFELRNGETIGIIGGNGAGKSTLLKIISRITEPTEGFAEIRGRIGSLLEVGTGFHPELTGRENTYLNGAILGMKKAEIKRKFDEIVSFSGIDKFIDTPVKHYSSGMYLRLAFAVAAHLEPEILIVDEVLAVGDSRFQKKCLDKMQDISQKGRSIVFVSHNMLAITQLCERAILLDNGRVVQEGPSHEVVRSYLNVGMTAMGEQSWPDPAAAPGGECARVLAVRVRKEDGQVTISFDLRQPVVVEMEYRVFKEGCQLLPNFRFINEEDISVFESLDNDPAWRRRPRPKGHYISSVAIPGNFLAEGKLFVSCHLISLYPTAVQFSLKKIISFEVVDIGGGDSARGDWIGDMDGVVRPLWDWKTQYDLNG
jgi:lipopolysaccharide transport system ATP-binding protein